MEGKVIFQADFTEVKQAIQRTLNKAITQHLPQLPEWWFERHDI
jgi:hypothetical protein